MKIRGKRASTKTVDEANPIQKMITLRLPIPIYNSVVTEAAKSSKSLNQFLTDLIGKHEESIKQQSEC